MSVHQRILLEHQQMDIILQRLAHQLIENHHQFSQSCLVGLQPRGILLAQRIHRILLELLPGNTILFGELDTTFYRDDFRRGHEIHTPKKMNMDFQVEGRKVILIDDVLFTGRSVRAALDALNDFGRPDLVELLVLVDRRYARHLPIEPSYTGIRVDTRSDDKVRVEWNEAEGNAVWILQQPHSTEA